jgi:hypothetical protein
MSVLDKAKGHYRSQVGGELMSIEVPEWETTVYYRQYSNFMTEQKIIEYHNGGKLAEALVETLIQKALDEDGKKLFRQADRAVLLREVDPNVIIRVCTAINANKDEVEEDLGN